MIFLKIVGIRQGNFVKIGKTSIRELFIISFDGICLRFRSSDLIFFATGNQSIEDERRGSLTQKRGRSRTSGFGIEIILLRRSFIILKHVSSASSSFKTNTFNTVIPTKQKNSQIYAYFLKFVLKHMYLKQAIEIEDSLGRELRRLRLSSTSNKLRFICFS